MSKLYFYDTGLICSLLGIHSEQQLEFHPLYGSIFENLIVSELIKQSYNRAKGEKLYFWRDNIGHEIDVIIDDMSGLFPVEIKSGATINNDFFKGLLYWLNISGIKRGAVIYSGKSTQNRSNGIDIVPWNRLKFFDP